MSTSGPLWSRMIEQPRRVTARLSESAIPTRCGVYAWFHNGEPMYAGSAIGGTGLRRRIWKEHLGTTHDLSRSSFRRNVCDHLGIAPISVSRQRPSRLTPRMVTPVNEWIRGCEVAWVEFRTEAEAKLYEADLLREWKPPLNRR